MTFYLDPLKPEGNHLPKYSSGGYLVCVTKFLKHDLHARRYFIIQYA